MSKEFEIASRIDLNTDEAMKKWQKFKSEAKELETIDLKVKISNINSIEKKLKGLMDLSKKVSDMQSKSKAIKVDNSDLKQQNEYLEKYKNTYRTIQRLQQQQSKETNKNSFKRMDEDIEKLKSNLKSFENQIKNSNLKLELFEFKQSNSDLVSFEKTLSNLTSKAEKLQQGFNRIEFKAIDTSQLEGEITQVLAKVEQLQVIGRQGVDVTIDLNNALSEIERLKTVMSNFSELDKIKSNFSSLESSITDALGTEAVERLKSEILSLESSVSQVDGTFDRLASSVKGSLGNAHSDIQKMNSELHKSSGFASDFAGSFYAYTAGNIVGDAIVGSIRGIKDAYLEIDAAMTNVIKVASNVETNSVDKLDNIRNKGIEIAKDVGQSTSDVLNAISDTVQAGVAKTLEGSMDIAKQTMMFANVGELEQSVASSAVNTMIRGFKVDPVTKYKKEVNGVNKEVTGLTTSMDALNFASNNYGINAQNLADAIQNGGNVLGAYGVSLNDTIALITSGVEVLGNGNKVGNGLKSIGINLAGMKASAEDGRSYKLPTYRNMCRKLIELLINPKAIITTT